MINSPRGPDHGRGSVPDPSRRALVEALTRAATPVVLVLVDLGRLESVISGLGHAMADRLVEKTLDRIASFVPSGSVVVRAADEVVGILLLDGGDDADGGFPRRLLAVLRAPFYLGRHPVSLRPAVGVAGPGQPGGRAMELLDDAWTALVEAKRRGPGSVIRFHAGLRAEALDALDLEADLRRALERDELRVHYQPIVDLDDGRVTSLEALVRWRHPQRPCLLQPDEFLPLAEREGLIAGIDLWVLRRALRRVAEWTRSAAPVVHVNLSPHHLRRGIIVEEVGRALEETGVAPDRLHCEVTESVLIDDPGAAALVLAELRELGAGVCIDDFGTGYSSLSYLEDLPVDCLKIDRSFLGGSPPGPGSVAANIVALGRDLGLRVIAEGVETGRQLEGLRTLGCDAAQGYLLCEPVPEEEVESVIAAIA